MKQKLHLKRYALAAILAGFAGVAIAESSEEGVSQGVYEQSLEDRYGTIVGITAIWKAELGANDAWESEFTDGLNSASDEELLRIQGASSYDEVIAILQGRDVPFSMEGVTGTEYLGSLSQDLTYTPVTPCRIFDTQYDNIAGNPTGNGSFISYKVHGTASELYHQGHNNGVNGGAGCNSPKGEPLAVAINLTVQPFAKGHLRAWPAGLIQPNASFLNYNSTVNTNLANAGIIATRYFYFTGDDISVSTWYGSARSLGDVMGYFNAATFLTKTKYLTLAGGACKYASNSFDGTNQPFFCDLTQNGVESQANWTAPLPTGAVVRGIRARVYSSGATTTCTLRSGTNNSGTIVATLTDSTSGWHDTAETTFIHTVSNSAQAYVVNCSAGSTATDNAVGYIRIRYTTQSPN